MNTRRIGAVPKTALWSGLKGGIFDAKHTKAMGSAIWLFGYLCMRQTQLNEAGEGVVRYGNPTSRADIAADTGWSDSNVKRWTVRLVRVGYIRTVRSGNDGLIFFIKKGKNKAKNPKCSPRFLPHSQGEVRCNGSSSVGLEKCRPDSQVGLHETNSRAESAPTWASNLPENQATAPSPTTLIPKNPFYYKTKWLADAHPSVTFLLKEVAKAKAIPKAKTERELDATRRLLLKQAEEIKAKYREQSCG